MVLLAQLAEHPLNNRICERQGDRYPQSPLLCGGGLAQMVERSLSSFEGHVVFAGEGSSILPWGLFVCAPLVYWHYTRFGEVSLLFALFLSGPAQSATSLAALSRFPRSIVG